MDVHKLNIVLLPDDATRTEALARARMLPPELRDAYRLGNQAEPHLTLYQAAFAEASVPDLARLVTGFGEEFRAPAVTFDFCRSYRGFLFWMTSTADKPALVSLQERVIASAVRWWTPTSVPHGLTDDEARHWRACGYHLVGESFLPHITLGKFESDDKALSAAFAIPLGAWRATLGTLALATVGESGQASTILASCPLKKGS